MADFVVRRNNFMRDLHKTVGNFADRQKKCFFLFFDENGFPQTRAMLQPREREGIKVFYLSTNISSLKVASLRKNPKACLYFVDLRFYRGICLTGTVEVLETAEAKERIWRFGDKMYYPLGVTDPDYCVLKFTAEKGRYYSDFKSEDFAIDN